MKFQQQIQIKVHNQQLINQIQKLSKQLRKTDAKRKHREFKKPRREVIILLEDIQYARNVASLFRTADAAGVKKIYLTGSSKTPPFGKDLQKASRKKERSVAWEYKETTGKAIKYLKSKDYKIVCLEVTEKAIPVSELKSRYNTKDKICLIAGNEVNGIRKTTLEKSDLEIFIPLKGKGASLNVSVAVAVALFVI